MTNENQPALRPAADATMTFKVADKIARLKTPWVEIGRPACAQLNQESPSEYPAYGPETRRSA